MDNLKKFPRVLIVGESFDTVTGGGITLSNLFRGWPKDRLAVASELRQYPNTEICNEFYRLGSAEWRFAWPLSYFIKNKRVSGKVNPELENAGQASSIQSFNEIWQKNTGYSIKTSFLWKIFYAVDDFVGGEAVIRQLRLSPELYEWINQFHPDLIYTQLGSLMLNSLVNQLSKAFQVPYVIHIMDDWPTTLYSDKLLAPYLCRRLNKEFNELLNHSSNFFGISQKMCNCYQEKYSRPCIPFHNPLELDRWLEASKKEWKANIPFRIMYRGHLGMGIQRSLVNICDAVYELYQAGRAVKFEITLTPTCDKQMKRELERPGCVTVKEIIPYTEIPTSLANADLLVLAYDFDSAAVNINRFSMPTRATEFMMSGTPILIYGPSELAVMEYAQEEKWGVIVAERNKKRLIQALNLLLDDQTLRERLGRRAQELAIRNHDAAQIRESFRQALAGAAG